MFTVYTQKNKWKIVSLGSAAYLGKATRPAAGWILRIHMKGIKVIIETIKRKKKIRTNYLPKR